LLTQNQPGSYVALGCASPPQIKPVRPVPRPQIRSIDGPLPRHRCTSSATDDVAASAYMHRLDQRVAQCLTDPSATLGTIAEQAEGAFPSLVAARLRARGHADVIARPEPAQVHAPPPPGPEQHPVDFEWYFEPDTAATLADELRPPAGETLLLGAPTVAVELRRRGAEALLVDRSPFLSARFGTKLGKARPNDLGRPLRQLRTHPAVFFDAPWHEDHINRWLWQASLAVRRGGRVAFAMFGKLTRPAAEDERNRILEVASLIGPVSLIPDALRYRTPPFESEALAAAGTPLDMPWRRGDLVLIDVRRLGGVPVPPPPVEERWTSWVVGDEVIKLRHPHRSPRQADRSPKSWVLETVSRRLSRRAQIEMWTSRNVVSRSIDYDAAREWLTSVGGRASGFEHSRAEVSSQASRR
jgi:hypothetical protein